MSDILKPSTENLLKDALKASGYNKVFVANRLGQTPQTLNYHLKHPDTDFVFKICGVLGIDPKKFLTKSYKNLLKN